MSGEFDEHSHEHLPLAQIRKQVGEDFCSGGTLPHSSSCQDLGIKESSSITPTAAQHDSEQADRIPDSTDQLPTQPQRNDSGVFNLMYSTMPSRIETSLGMCYLLSNNPYEEMCLDNVFKIGQVFTWKSVPIAAWSSINAHIPPHMANSIPDDDILKAFPITSAFIGIVQYVFPFIVLQTAHTGVYAIPLPSGYSLDCIAATSPSLKIIQQSNSPTTTTPSGAELDPTLCLQFAQLAAFVTSRPVQQLPPTHNHLTVCLDANSWYDCLALLALSYLFRVNPYDVLTIPFDPSFAVERTPPSKAIFFSFQTTRNDTVPPDTVVLPPDAVSSTPPSSPSPPSSGSIRCSLPPELVHLSCPATLSMHDLRQMWYKTDPVMQYLTCDAESARGVRILDQSRQIVECIWAFICSQNSNTLRIAANMQWICQSYGTYHGTLYFKPDLVAETTSTQEAPSSSFAPAVPPRRRSTKSQSLQSPSQQLGPGTWAFTPACHPHFPAHGDDATHNHNDQQQPNPSQAPSILSQIPLFSFPFLSQLPQNPETLETQLAQEAKVGYRASHFAKFAATLSDLDCNSRTVNVVPLSEHLMTSVVRSVQQEICATTDHVNQPTDPNTRHQNTIFNDTLCLIHPHSFLYTPLPFKKRDRQQIGSPTQLRFVELKRRPEALLEALLPPFGALSPESFSPSGANFVTQWDTLQTFAGVGPKVASCIALFALQNTAIVPMDTHVLRLFSHYYVPVLTPKAVTFFYWFHKYYIADQDIATRKSWEAQKAATVAATSSRRNAKTVKKHKESKRGDDDANGHHPTVQLDHGQLSAPDVVSDEEFLVVLYKEQIYKLQLQIYASLASLLQNEFMPILWHHLAQLASTSSSPQATPHSSDNQAFVIAPSTQRLPLQVVFDTTSRLLREYIAAINGVDRTATAGDQPDSTTFASFSPQTVSGDIPALQQTGDLATAFSALLITSLGDYAGLAHSVMFSALLRHNLHDKHPKFHWFRVQAVLDGLHSHQ